MEFWRGRRAGGKNHSVSKAADFLRYTGQKWSFPSKAGVLDTAEALGAFKIVARARRPASATAYAPPHAAMELDDFDRLILQSMQEDNQRTSQEVAERVNLSPVSCLRRMKRLRDAGVVAADVSVVDPAAVGRGIMMVVLVSLESERADKLGKFKRAMTEAPEVMQCMSVTGEVDFVLTLTMRDMLEYESFAQKHFWGDPNVKRFSTLVVMNQVKQGCVVPVG